MRHFSLFFFLVLRKRQGEDELRTDAFGTDDIDVLAVGPDDLFDDRKSQAGAAFVFAARAVALIEAVPDL